MRHPLDTPEGALEEALRWEATANKITIPGDPALAMALRETDFWLDQAVRLEEREKANG